MEYILHIFKFTPWTWLTQHLKLPILKNWKILVNSDEIQKMKYYCKILGKYWKFWKLSRKCLKNFQQISARNLDEFYVRKIILKLREKIKNFKLNVWKN